MTAESIGKRIAFVLLLFCGGANALRADSLFDEGRQAQAAGQYQQAETAYRAFLKEQPQSVPALTNLGVVLAHQGRFDAAIVEYNQALTIDRKAKPPRINLALAYYRMSKWLAAAEVFEALGREVPDDRRITQLLAICDMQLKRYSQALAAYRKLMPSDDPSVLIGFASALRETGQRTESEQVFASVLEQHSDSPEAQYLLGLAEFARGDYSAAEGSFTKTIELAPARVDGYFYLGATYLKQRKLDAAVDIWKRATSIDSRYFPVIFTTGALLAQIDRYGEARPFLEMALQQRPSDGATQLEMGRLYLHENKCAEALPYLSRASIADPKSKQASYLLATAYARLGRKTEADAEFRRSRQLFSEDAAQTMLAEATRVSQETAP